MIFTKKTFFIFILAFFINGCDFKTTEQKNIDLVKESLLYEGVKVKDLARDLTAIDGQISWKSFISNSNQHIVQMVVSRKIKSKNKKIKMQWKVNPDSGYVELAYVEYDGKPTSKLLFSIYLLEWAL